MTSLRYFALLSIIPLLLALGLLLEPWVGGVLVVAFLALLAWQARRLGAGFGMVVGNFARAYAAVPRLLWAVDRRAAERAAPEGAEPRAVMLGRTRFYSDLALLEARELEAVVRRTHEGLAELFPGCRPVDRVLLFGTQQAMLDYLGGWYGRLGTKAAGFCFAMGPVRVVGAVDAFRELGRDPRALLAHELVHGGLRGVARGVAMRPWLNEGLAEALAVTWIEPARLPGIQRFVRRARAAGHWLGWEALEGSRPGHLLAWLRSGDSSQLMKAQLLYSEACLVVLELSQRDGSARPCLRALLAKPREAERIMRRDLGFGGEDLLAWVGREVDAAALDLTPWDRARRAALRELLAQDPPSRFRASAALGLAACGDAEDLPLLASLASAEDAELSAQAELSITLIETDGRAEHRI